MKPTFDPIKTPKTPAAVEKAARTSTRSNARFFEEETPETNGKRSDENLRQPELEVAMGNSELKLEEESEEELSRQLGLEQTGGNSIELMLKELDESLKKLKLELEQLEKAGEDSMELTPEEELELELELRKLEQEGVNSMELTPEEESDLEIKLMEQQLKKEGEEKRREKQLEKDKKTKEQLESQAKDKGNFSPLITPSRNPSDLLGGMSAKGGAAAEEELGKEEPEIENRNRTSFFTRIGNMISISSFCRSLITNRGGAAAEVELGEKEAHKQARNKEQIESEPENQKDRSDEERAERELKLQQAQKALAAVRKIQRNLSKDLRKIKEEGAEKNKDSREKIRALREEQAEVRRKTIPSNALTGARATTTSKSLPNSRHHSQ